MTSSLENKEDIDLGFAEKRTNKFHLSSIGYPSKLGGKPAWLTWNELPKYESLQCNNCKKPMMFLCQLYVPIELCDNKNEIAPFHRMVYMFCCLEGNCFKKKCAVKVFRSLRIESEKDLTENELDTKTEQELYELLKRKESSQSLCNLCGCHGDKKCAGCHIVSYCSKDHQLYDWKKGGHSNICKGAVKDTPKNKYLFDEYEIVTEAEPEEEKFNKKEEEIYKEYLKKNVKEKDDSIDKSLEKEFTKMTTSATDDYFMDFKLRIQREPEQIIRYNPGGEPLWVSSENIPSKDDIPKCLCGAERQFEFQVLPQMLNYLGIETTINSIDWGTLCVYTCITNCNHDNNTYNEEFLWQQDFSSTAIG